MKVLFAIGKVQTSQKVAEIYYSKYGEELEYKNVFFFKALLDEVKKDKTYDRIVISEDLEQFSNVKSIEAFDRVIFNYIDSITDEIEDSEIIFICSDRRTKQNDSFVERLFNIGIYNMLIGDERTFNTLCDYIKKPLNKKEAKRHLNITSVVSVGSPLASDDTVDEDQIISILKYYDNMKINGKTSQAEYIKAFDGISEQYNKNQLKVILHYLPLDVKNAVYDSDKYSFLIDEEELIRRENKAKVQKKISNRPSKRGGLFGILRDNKNKESQIGMPKVTVDNSEKEIDKSPQNQKLQVTTSFMSEDKNSVQIQAKSAENDIEVDVMSSVAKESLAKEQEELRKKAEQEALAKEQEELRKKAEQEALAKEQEELRKKAEQEALAKEQEELRKKAEQEALAKEQEELRKKAEQEALANKQGKILDNISEDMGNAQMEQDRIEEERRKLEQEKKALEEEKRKLREQTEKLNQNIGMTAKNEEMYENPKKVDYKKMVLFVGANKSGTTFVVNAVAHALAAQKINVGVLDMSRDKSMYYIYNQDDKTLRDIAYECMQKLSDGIDSYIPVNKNLKIYTSVSSSDLRKAYKNRMVIDTVREANDLVIVDADFSTPFEYFEKASDICIVQDLDIMKIQETTLFLRELKNKGIDMNRIRIVINKYVKTMLTPKKLIEGLSYYNDPQMSFIDELLSNKVPYFIVPFAVENYIKYIEGMLKNELDYRKYTPEFMEAINALSNTVFMTSGEPKKKRGLFG